MERLRENIDENSPLLEGRMVQDIAKDTGVNIREIGMYEVKHARYGFRLEFGRKRLLLLVTDVRCQFNTDIKNVMGKEEKLQEETSTLYRAAKKLMEAYVRMKQHDYKYIFTAFPEIDKKGTKNVMRDWALTRGQEIFDWEKIEGSDREDFILQCFRTFYYKE